MDTGSLKEILTTEVGQSAVWRAEKAEEYPDDQRNAVAAKELGELEKALENLPADDPRFKQCEQVSGVLFDDECYPTEELNQYQSRVGFDQLADVGSFLSSYMGILNDALARDTGNAKKAWENRLRRSIEHHGYTLRKSGVRDPYAPTYGLYWIIDPETDDSVLDGGAADGALNLTDIDMWIKTPEGEELRWSSEEEESPEEEAFQDEVSEALEETFESLLEEVYKERYEKAIAAGKRPDNAKELAQEEARDIAASRLEGMSSEILQGIAERHGVA